MAESKQSLMALDLTQDPITQIQSKFTEIQTHFNTWLAKQSLPVEAAVVTATGALHGGVIGGFIGILTGGLASSVPTPPPGAANLNPQAMASLQQTQALSGGPLVQCRNLAMVCGVKDGISCVLKRLRGKEDVQSTMIAAFGSGTIYSLVSDAGGPNQLRNAVASGLFLALILGGISKVEQEFRQASLYEDVNYIKTKTMLANLGMQEYEKNFKKGLLTDNTLPLLNESALRDASIPPGPRLLILDHIQRDPELKKSQAGRQKR